jgi:hypothetical protein
MAKIYVQNSPCPWGSSASMAASGTQSSGSFPTTGYARLVGTLNSSASLVAGSGLRVEQSTDFGSNWDYASDWAPTACSGSGFSIEIIGDAAKITITNGADNADVFRTAWRLRPV